MSVSTLAAATSGTFTEKVPNLERLFKLRVVVARYGEMDLAGWWNTKGQLGKFGAMALRRGFPRTHYFAQARAVFAVAAHRCKEVYDLPDGVSLWRMPEAIEYEFDVRWEYWLEHAAEWAPFFQRVESIPKTDLAETLRQFELVTDAEVKECAALRRSAEGRTVMIPGTFTGRETEMGSLALGFTRGEPGALAVPYLQRATK